MRVIKIGGNELDKPDFMPTFAKVLHDRKRSRSRACAAPMQIRCALR
jgi:hypothetical protein